MLLQKASHMPSFGGFGLRNPDLEALATTLDAGISLDGDTINAANARGDGG